MVEQQNFELVVGFPKKWGNISKIRWVIVFTVHRAPTAMAVPFKNKFVLSDLDMFLEISVVNFFFLILLYKILIQESQMTRNRYPSKNVETIDKNIVYIF